MAPVDFRLASYLMKLARTPFKKVSLKLVARRSLKYCVLSREVQNSAKHFLNNMAPEGVRLASYRMKLAVTSFKEVLLGLVE